VPLLLPLTWCAAARKDKGQIYTFLNAMLNQYDNEDFDLGIKQFMIEQVRSSGGAPEMFRVGCGD
jgi:hypothetical protein